MTPTSSPPRPPVLLFLFALILAETSHSLAPQPRQSDSNLPGLTTPAIGKTIDRHAGNQPGNDPGQLTSETRVVMKSANKRSPNLKKSHFHRRKFFHITELGKRKIASWVNHSSRQSSRAVDKTTGAVAVPLDLRNGNGTMSKTRNARGRRRRTVVLAGGRCLECGRPEKRAGRGSARTSGRLPGQASGFVSVLGLFELSKGRHPRPEGKAELDAARLAVQHVNEQKILGEVILRLFTNDTKCDPGVGVDAFFHALYTRKEKMVILLGSACSEVTESLAKVTPYWSMLQVSFGSTSAALSERREFPLFYRTVAPDSSHNPARVAFIKKFAWKTVTALSQHEDVYSLGVNGLVTEMERANITCKATITFAESDFKDQLKRLRDLDTRIIIGSFSPTVGPKIFCEVRQLLGLLAPAWLIRDSERESETLPLHYWWCLGAFFQLCIPFLHQYNIP